MQEYTLETPRQPVRVAIAAAEFNRFITDQLLEGARSALSSHGVSDDQLSLAWVPGAYELPLAADRLLAAGDCDAVIALGAVIRGGTPHFDYVAGDCSRGLMDVGLKYGKPVIFGVLTTDTIEQALERAALDRGNKGHDVALAALQMVALSHRLDKQP
ncbi:MAG: 6,7-dimethyl-8-ribityllumazine synthase [Xanthomonadales bacterium]|jgi:6,7-dimethyl-8-ribityllumazine synthase|nr:6,7-dimethyl-8-ribityllumazine synthase [Xanthomonadales bacterium]